MPSSASRSPEPSKLRLMVSACSSACTVIPPPDLFWAAAPLGVGGTSQSASADASLPSRPATVRCQRRANARSATTVVGFHSTCSRLKRSFNTSAAPPSPLLNSSLTSWSLVTRGVSSPAGRGTRPSDGLESSSRSERELAAPPPRAAAADCCNRSSTRSAPMEKSAVRRAPCCATRSAMSLVRSIASSRSAPPCSSESISMMFCSWKPPLTRSATAPPGAVLVAGELGVAAAADVAEPRGLGDMGVEASLKLVLRSAPGVAGVVAAAAAAAAAVVAATVAARAAGEKAASRIALSLRSCAVERRTLSEGAPALESAPETTKCWKGCESGGRMQVCSCRLTPNW